MNILIAIDEINTLNTLTDSTLFIAESLKIHSLDIKFFHPKSIFYNGSIYVDCFELDKDYNIINQNPNYDLEQADIIMIRQNPPVDMQYITDIQLLNTLSHPKIVNRPKTLITYPEKTISFEFKEYIPKTIISSNPDELIAWVKSEERAILKSIHGYGGQQVIFVNKDNPEKILDFAKQFNHVIAQEFLPNINLGDKRVLTVGNQIVGALRRTPKTGSILANMCQGGSASICSLTPKEEEICQKLVRWCEKHGIMFSGIDLIDERLIEVNITCPTGYKVIDNLNPELNLSEIIYNTVKNHR